MVHRPRSPFRVLPRRQLLGLAALSPALAAVCRVAGEERKAHRSPARLFFTSQGKTALIEAAAGAKPRWLSFDAPGQETWQPGPFLPGGRVVFLSMEARRDGPGKPFDEYYTQTPTHLWLYDLDTGELREICNRERLAVFVTPALALSDDRLLVQVVRNKVGQIYSVKLDGTDAREFTGAGEGLPYGLSLSPDGKRVAFHLASPEGYQVWTSDLEGRNRVKVAAHPNHLYFGTSWSPDGRWILYVDCPYRQDPGHDWCDVCIGRPDGSEHRVLTSGQAMWFAATYGSPGNRGGGSNLPAWTRDGRILFPRRLPGSQVPWEYQAGRRDVDHFNREYRPEQARGGTEICRLDPRRGSVERLTRAEPGRWDFRAVEAPDGRQIAFCRAATGEAPGLWIMNAARGGARLLSRGYQDRGADHPRWLPAERA
jgi:TolB protein